jgi:Mn-containing catalase
LINFTDDSGTKDALQFLMTGEITHMKAFTAALESLVKALPKMAKVASSDLLRLAFEKHLDETRGSWIA